MSLPSSTTGGDSPALLEHPIGTELASTVARWPDREALVGVEQGLRYTWVELAAAVQEVACGLIAAGIGPGDRVAVWAPNRVEWVLVQYAAARVGAVLVTVNPAFRSPELAFVLRQSGTRMLCADTHWRDSDYVAMVDSVRAELPALERVVHFGTSGWEDLLRNGSGVTMTVVSAREAAVRAEDACTIQYTSGTTGTPKGATLSHRNIVNNGLLVGDISGYTETDRICAPVPLYHCFGQVMAVLGALTHGACTVLPGAVFDPAATLAAVETERCTSLYGVPTMFMAELADPSFPARDLSSLRTGIMAGSPCPVETMKRVIDEMHMPEVTIAYGMTETSPVSTQTRRADDLDRRVSTVGRVHPHVGVQIVDVVTGEVVPRGTTGELCTSGYGVMLGYWEDQERTAEAVDRLGRMHTGDLAVMDDDGYLAIVGRSKDMVIRGGENIYPREVEEVLYAHPDVADVQVVGVPDEHYGEELMAWVRPRPGALVDPEEVRAFTRERLARYKVPRHVVVLAADEEFPMTVTGKVQKYVLRERAVEVLGLA